MDHRQDSTTIYQINTHGGAAITGPVEVNGDFAGRDMLKIISTAPILPPEEAKHLHLAYLRSCFAQKWAQVSLADYSDSKLAPVSLLDVYVPLTLDFSVTIQLKDHKLLDWWSEDEYATKQQKVREVGVAASRKDELKEEAKRRDWPSLKVGEKEIQRLVDHYVERYGNQIDEKDPFSIYMEAQDAATVQPRFVLVGDPGTGKSSFVRHLTLCMAGQQLFELNGEKPHERANIAALVDWLEGSYTPLYIELRDLVKTVFAPLPADDNAPVSLPTLNDFWRYVHDHQLLGLEGYLPELYRRMVRGDVLLMLDGLDEVSNAADPRRREQIKTLVRMLGQYNGRVIVTSRSHAYRKGEWVLDGYGRAELRPLHSDRLDQLAQALFAQLDRLDEVAAFNDALKKIADGLKTNPLFFTLLAAIWLRSQPPHSLPNTEGELYARSVGLMLSKWTRLKVGELSLVERLKLTEAQLRQVVQGVALEVQGNGEPNEDSTLFDALDLIKKLRCINKYAPAQEIIDDLEQRSGLLVSPESDRFRFAHRSFQEYLAACELLQPCPAFYANGDPDWQFPAALVRRVMHKPDLWLNVANHAADWLKTHEPTVLWELLPRLFEPYVEGSQDPAHAQAALLALQLAQRHALLTDKRKKYTPGAAVLDGFAQAALRAMRDNALPAVQRAEAGRALAKLGDPRKEVMTVDAIELCDVPAGKFWMGAEKDHAKYPDNMADDYEGPLHRQYTAAFRISRYPITQAQYAEFVEATNDPANKPHEYDNNTFHLPNHPVVGVSWRQAVAFTDWLTERWRQQKKISNQQVVRLPTEAEWEKAARGMTDARRYPWGPDPNPNAANYNDSGIGSTSAVGCFSLGRTPFGCEEMSGNVWEWTLTKWLDDYQDYDQKVDTSLQGEDSRVVRGGAFNGNQGGARCAVRDWYHPDDLDYLLGFRVVVSPAS